MSIFRMAVTDGVLETADMSRLETVSIQVFQCLDLGSVSKQSLVSITDGS